MLNNSIMQPFEEVIERLKTYQNDRISLISSENVSSSLLRASYLLGLSDQYCSRLPQDRGIIDNLTFGNVDILDDINYMVREKVKSIFKAAECEIRLLSGLSGLTVLLFSLLERNQILLKMYDLHGGHLSVSPISKKLGLQVKEMFLDKNYRLDLDRFYKTYKSSGADVIFLDSSYVLFPYPLKKIREIVGAETVIMYDASHVIALVGNGFFQDPLNEGANVIHSTTHKSLWGPQKAMFLFKEKSGPIIQKMRHYTKDLVSNTHLHHIMALYIALLEFQFFGQDYARQLKLNAKSFAKSLDSEGLDVEAKECGYTESNQLWVRFPSKKKASALLRKLEDICVSANLIFLPFDNWGWRLGVNELTRRGAKEDDFKQLASIIADHIFEKTERMPQERAREFKKQFKGISYSFDKMPFAQDIINKMVNVCL